jgi:predicted PurR-regulated permease PerM
MSDTQPAHGLIAAAAAALVVALTLYLLVVGEAILIPLVLAIFITYLIVAVAHGLQRIKVGDHGLPRGLALIAAALLFVLVIAVLVQLIAGNVRAVVEAAPGYQTRLQGLVSDVNVHIASTLNLGTPLTVTSVLDQIDLRSIMARLAGIFQGIAGNTFQILIYVAFLLLEVGTFDRKLTAMFPGEARQVVLRGTLRQIGHKIERYVLIKTGMSLLIGLLTFTTLSLLQVDFAPFFGLLHFVLNFVPYIGAIVGIALPTLLALLQFGTLGKVIAVVGVLCINQVLVENVLETKLAGKTLNLSPLIIMLGLSVWGSMWGIIGMVLSVPIMVMVMIALSQFPRTRPFAVLMSESGELR